MNIPKILGRENKFTGMEHFSDSTVTDIEVLQDLDVMQSGRSSSGHSLGLFRIGKYSWI